MFIKEETIDFFHYLRKPEDAILKDASTSKKWKLWFTCFLLDIVFANIIAGLFYLLDRFVIQLKHSDMMLEDHIIVILLAACIIAPLLEEFIFRLPLRYRNNFIFQFIDQFTKRRLVRFWYKHYGVFFYTFSIAFGLIHITNFTNNTFLFYAFIPLIVAPQTFGGLTMGYTRVKLGFWWGVLLHSAYNLTLLLLSLTFNTDTKIDIQNEGKIESFYLEEVEHRTGDKEKDAHVHFFKYTDNNGIFSIDSIQYNSIDVKYMPLRELLGEMSNAFISNDSVITKFQGKYKYQLLDKNVLVNFHLKAKEPIFIDEIMEIISEEYDIEITKDTSQVDK